MSNISTFIESPKQCSHLTGYAFDTLIIDLPFCSVRSHHPYDWSNEELNQLTELAYNHLALNLDGIYTDHELDVILTTIKNRGLDQCFQAFRIQDPGLILWIQDHFPDMAIQLNPETGLQNSVAISTLFKKGLSLFTLNHETPYRVIQSFLETDASWTLELLVQGPILIQYSRRRFLSDRYDTDPSTPIRLEAEDTDLPERSFTFLNTAFGHFMFAQFHRCLAKYSDKLSQLNGISWLIDARGASDDYLKTSLALYHALYTHPQHTIDDYVHDLAQMAQKPQKPGFFLSNNTDYDWRDHQKPSPQPSVGAILSVKKNDAVMLEFCQTVTMDAQLICHNRDDSSTTFDLSQLKDLSLAPVQTISLFTPYIITPPIKGLQVKGILYLKDS